MKRTVSACMQMLAVWSAPLVHGSPSAVVGEGTAAGSPPSADDALPPAAVALAAAVTLVGPSVRLARGGAVALPSRASIVGGSVGKPCHPTSMKK